MDIRLVDTRSGRLVATTSVEGLVQEKEFGGGTIAGGGGRRRNKGPHEEAVRKALQAATGWIVSQTPADYYHYR
jgi:curli biogenesis system outer membrane secretion channel CsgG